MKPIEEEATLLQTSGGDMPHLFMSQKTNQPVEKLYYRALQRRKSSKTYLIGDLLAGIWQQSMLFRILTNSSFDFFNRLGRFSRQAKDVFFNFWFLIPIRKLRSIIPIFWFGAFFSWEWCISFTILWSQVFLTMLITTRGKLQFIHHWIGFAFDGVFHSNRTKN